MKIAITSKSFSKNPVLREKLLSHFPNSYFNDDGKKFSEHELIEFLKDADAAIIALEKINDHILAQLPNLKIISKYGVGTDNINFDSLKKFKIKWSYQSGTNKRGVAELALQMMLTLLRKSYQSNINLKDGDWSPHFGNNLTGKKIGILGLGNIGKELVLLLKAFQCQISCTEINPDFNFIKEHNLKLVSLNELFTENQIVSIHIPKNAANTKIVDQSLLASMGKSSILINTARGGIVDEEVLFQKLKQNSSFSAGFDVFEEEPFLKTDILNLANFYCTPHIGGSSIEGILAMGEAAISGLFHAKLLDE